MDCLCGCRGGVDQLPWSDSTSKSAFHGHEKNAVSMLTARHLPPHRGVAPSHRRAERKRAPSGKAALRLARAERQGGACFPYKNVSMHACMYVSRVCSCKLHPGTSSGRAINGCCVTRRKLQRPDAAKEHNKTKIIYKQPKRPSIGTIHRPSTGHHRSPRVKS